MGSPSIASWIAHVAFWGLLVYGFALGELSLKRLAIFLILWLTGLIGLSQIPYDPARAMFPSYVALLDIALVFTIFKADVGIG
ncbi:MAG: hypothetical protein DMG02_02385 [Acidobacteria bacterium]|nr:MAG: hypothetical protein DMG03_26890 [Acidobacteriota bacterium]PYQ92268.1 MAG: hypothetical protein DMG02_02385 [Acidobacteriota bacterium]